MEETIQKPYSFKTYLKKFWKGIKIICLSFLPFVLLLLPANYFDEGQSISIFALFGVEDLVYSTGMTRSIMHLIHFDFVGAAEYNKLSFIVLPILVMLWLKLLLKEFNIFILKWF